MSKKILYILLAVCGGALLLCVVTYFKSVHNILGQSIQLDYGEGFEWAVAKVVEVGKPLYPVYSTPTVLPVLYTPIYFLVVGNLAKVFGDSFNLGRLASIVSMVVASGMLGLTVLNLTKSRVTAVITSLLLFTVVVVRFWSLTYRVDLLAVALLTVSLHFTVKYIDNKKMFLLLAVPLMVLTLFAKQSLVPLPVAVGIYLLLKNRKLLLPFVVVLVVLGLVGLLGMYLAWHWTAILDIFVRVSGMPWHLSIGLGIMHYTASTMLPLLCLALIYVIWDIKKRTMSLPALFWVVSFGTGLYTSSKIGANSNDCIPFVVATCLLSGLLLGRLFSLSSEKGLKSYIVPLSVVLLCIVWQCSTSVTTVINYSEGTEKTYTEIEDLVRPETGPILSGNAMYLLNLGKACTWEPATVVLCDLYKTSPPLGYDQTVFVNQLNSGYYPMIILDFGIDAYYGPNTGWNYWGESHAELTDQMAGAIKDNYSLVFHSGGVSEIPGGEYIYKFVESK